MTASGFTLSGVGRSEIEIKKSRFVGTALPLPDVEQVGTLLQAASDAEARHNCWAWRHGQRYRFHDADEPAGTAGKPILAAIDGQRLDRVLVVVTRWFGGIKLGAGGLVRAYAQAAAEALRAAPTEVVVVLRSVRLSVPWKWRDAVTRLAHRCSATTIRWQDQLDGAHLTFQLPASQFSDFESAIRDLSAGQLACEAD